MQTWASTQSKLAINSLSPPRAIPVLLVRAAASLAEHALPLLALVVCVAHDHPVLVMLQRIGKDWKKKGSPKRSYHLEKLNNLLPAECSLRDVPCEKSRAGCAQSSHFVSIQISWFQLAQDADGSLHVIERDVHHCLITIT